MPFDTPATENAERHATKLTKRHLMKPFWVLLVPFLFPSALAAEPSLAETIQYIETKLKSWKTNYRVFYEGLAGFSGWRYDERTFRLKGQTVTYGFVETHTTHTGEKPATRWEYTFQLSALSSAVRVSSKNIQEFYGWGEKRRVSSLSQKGQMVGVVQVICARGECISPHFLVEGKRQKAYDQVELIFYVDPYDMERVQKALTHAIELSGGKDELF